MRSIFPLMAALLVSACYGRTTTLGQAVDVHLGLGPLVSVNGNVVEPLGFGVSFNYDVRGGCIVFSASAKATVNGVEVPFTPPPEPHPSIGGPDCGVPLFTFPLEKVNQQDTTIALEDGPDRSAVVIRDLAGPLVLSVTPPAGGVIRAGSTIGLNWSPASDDLSHMDGAFTSASKTTNLDMGTFQGGHAQFTVPADASPGTATIMLSGIRSPQVVRCEGVATCSVGYDLVLSWPSPYGAVSTSLQIEP